MGTRSLTKIISKWEDKNGNEKRRPTACMYRQYDGYLEGHGIELAEFLAPFTIVNGFGSNDKSKVANGMDCLAAQMIAHFKDGIGDIYLMHPDTTDVGEEYIYEIEESGNDKQLAITVTDGDQAVIFKGTVQGLIKTITDK